jgi:hypothetical protein
VRRSISRKGGKEERKGKKGRKCEDDSEERNHN